MINPSLEFYSETPLIREIEESLDKPQELIKILNDLIGSSTNEKEILPMILNTLTAHSYANLTTLIKSIIIDPICSERLFFRSYYHTNGFVKLVLLSDLNFKLRLHIFSPKDSPEHPHDHRWNFASEMLKGSFTTEILAQGEGEKFKHYQVTHAGLKADKENLEFLSEKELKVLYSTDVRDGDRYFLDRDYVHRVTKIGDEGCITIIIRGKDDKHKSNDFTKEELKEGESELIKYSKEEIINMVHSVLKHLESKKK